MPFSIFGPQDPFMPTGAEGGLPWWLSAAELWQMLGGLTPPNFFASRPPEYSIPPPPSGGGEFAPAIDPKTGVPQDIINRLWQIEPPEWAKGKALEPHPVFGLPNWMIGVIQRFAEIESKSVFDYLPVFLQTLPFTTLLEIFLGGEPPARIDPETGMPVWTVDVTETAPETETPVTKTPGPVSEIPGPVSQPPGPRSEAPPPSSPTPPPLILDPMPRFEVDVWDQPESPPPPPPPPPGQPPFYYEPLPPPPNIPGPGPGTGSPVGPQQPSEEENPDRDDRNDRDGRNGPPDTLGSLIAGSAGMGAPLPGQPAPNIGQFRNIISLFQVLPYLAEAPLGLRLRR